MKFKNSLYAFSAGLLFLVAMVGKVQADVVLSGGGLTLLQEGPPSSVAGKPDVPLNLALGKTAFALDELDIGGLHLITKVTNGSYGNSSSWIGNGATGIDGPFIGVDLGGTFNINQMAFGRSNVLSGDPCPGGICTDRNLGLYTLQFTAVASPDNSLVTTGDASTGWADIGTLNYQSAGGTNFTAPHQRHLYAFDPVNATGIRLIVPGTGLSGGTAIDEIEVLASATPAISAGCAAVNSSMVSKDYRTSFYANVGPYHSSIGPTTPYNYDQTISDFAVGDTINIHIQGQGHYNGTWTLKNGSGGTVSSFVYSNNPICDINNSYCHGANRTYVVTGLNDDTTLTQKISTGAGITTAHPSWGITCTPGNPNLPPTAAAGIDQSIRAGDTVNLDGSASSDDNTLPASLGYSWSFSSFAGGVAPTLTDANTATPSFVADVAGTYVVDLVVTDSAGLNSLADSVEISSDNLAPTALASVGSSLVIVGNTAYFDGSDSFDPEGDLLTYAWTITAAPLTSIAVLTGDDTANPTLSTDLEGAYEATLTVSDFLGAGTPVTVEVVATSPVNYAETQIVDASDTLEALPLSEVTTQGNQEAFSNFLKGSTKDIQKGKIDNAIGKLNQALERTDGCALRGSPDGNGKGMDWITDCGAQAMLYGLLQEAINALTP